MAAVLQNDGKGEREKERERETYFNETNYMAASYRIMKPV